MKNQKGITLIALVVTIVVLLILAGTSIAMLTGDNGIITNAQKSQAANTEGEVVDKMGLAYNTLNTEARIKMSTDNGYQPSAHVAELAATVAKELNLAVTDGATEYGTADSGYHVTWTTTGAAKITITYADAKFDLDPKTASTNNKYAKLESTINLTTTGVSYVAPVKTVGLSQDQIDANS